jgi:hypothetical protein
LGAQPHIQPHHQHAVAGAGAEAAPGQWAERGGWMCVVCVLVGGRERHKVRVRQGQPHCWLAQVCSFATGSVSLAGGPLGRALREVRRQDACAAGPTRALQGRAPRPSCLCASAPTCQR